jgi:hypothetical protein
LLQGVPLGVAQAGVVAEVTRAPADRRQSDREIRRCLKRYIPR